ncbi:MAG: hypothetical protein KDN22_09480 [Verrucomicrobiae bacterium]|nr:hypothetical protein [Verrucomicrobiae bacterium]
MTPSTLTNIRSVLLALGILATPVAVMALLLLVVAVSWDSRTFGAGILGWVMAALLAGLAGLSNPSRAKTLSMVSWAFALASAIALLASRFLFAPGETSATDPFQVVYIDQNGHPAPTRYNRWSPAALVSEVDQLAMGTALISWIDPYIDTEKANRIDHVFHAVYEDMRSKSPAHVAAGSQLGAAYRDLADWEFQNGHGYAYRPATLSGPLPVLLFLHGSLGNFKGYLWVLQDLADRLGMAIVAPTFGAGNWNEPGGVETVARWLRYCENDVSLDSSNIVLAGISNGGRGVTRTWTAMPERFSAVVCISPVFEAEILEQAFAHASPPAGPMLVIHGTQDARIPEAYITGAVECIRRIGIQCDYQSFAGEDHFLLFSQPGAVIQHIEHWLRDRPQRQ